MLVAIYDCLILQLCCERVCGSEREKGLAPKLVGYIDKSKRQAQQLGSLRHDVRSLSDALPEMRRDKLSLTEELHGKSEENHSLTETLKEKLAELRKALTD